VVVPVIPTVTTVIQQAIPTFLFSYNGPSPFPLTNYGQQQDPQQSFQMPQQAPTVPQVGSLSLNDTQMAKLADMVVQRLQSNVAASQVALVAPPQLAQDEPVQRQPSQMTQAIANDFGAKCSRCHMEGTAAKGSLTLFDANHMWAPKKSGIEYNDYAKIYQRIAEGSMPPTAIANQNDRSTPESIEWARSMSVR